METSSLNLITSENRILKEKNKVLHKLVSSHYNEYMQYRYKTALEYENLWHEYNQYRSKTTLEYENLLQEYKQYRTNNNDYKVTENTGMTESRKVNKSLYTKVNNLWSKNKLLKQEVARLQRQLSENNIWSKNKLLEHAQEVARLQRQLSELIANSEPPSTDKTDVDLLDAYFVDEKQAYSAWTCMCDADYITLGTLARYTSFYPIICKVFREKTECCRVPTAAYLKGFVFNKANDKDNISCEEFLNFWRAFMECCMIVKEDLQHLWDVKPNNSFLCNIFVDREESHQILKEFPDGTFVIRLSSTVKGGVVLSYMEMRQIKHTLLVRKGTNKYEKFKSSGKTENGKMNLSSLSNIIKSSDELQFLYTPNGTSHKNKIILCFK
eukprot:953528_1